MKHPVCGKLQPWLWVNVQREHVKSMHLLCVSFGELQLRKFGVKNGGARGNIGSLNSV